jgi:hypothetical protein
MSTQSDNSRENLSLRYKYIICVLLFVVTTSVFWQVLTFAFIFYDDPSYVTDNPHVISGLTWRKLGLQ